VSEETGIPARWGIEPGGENILWRIDDPGFGHSSPIVQGDALFITTAIGEERVLLRLDARDGREAWRRTVLEAPLERKHGKNSFASSTPATDGERVYVAFLDRQRAVAAAYDYSGGEVWKVSPGEFHSIHGFCSSPVLFRDLVIINCDQDADAYIVAIDRRTGAERWRANRENKVRSYCPPTIFEIGGEPQMILSGSMSVCSYDPRTGKRIWICDGPTEQMVASLVYGNGLVFVTGGYPELHVLAIDPTGTGNVTRSHIRWRSQRGAGYVPSPLYHDGHIYVVSDGGVISAIAAETGEYRNQKRLRGNVSASLLYAGGLIYCFGESGAVFALRAGPDLETAAEVSMADPIYATPAVSRGRMFLRTWKHLYAIGSKKRDASTPAAGGGQ
jgi:hypothetical protein